MKIIKFEADQSLIVNPTTSSMNTLLAISSDFTTASSSDLSTNASTSASSSGLSTNVSTLAAVALQVSSSSSLSSSSSSSTGTIRKTRRRKIKIGKKNKKIEKRVGIVKLRRETTSGEKNERNVYEPCNDNQCNRCGKICLSSAARLKHQQKKYPHLKIWCSKAGCGCVFGSNREVRRHQSEFPH